MNERTTTAGICIKGDEVLIAHRIESGAIGGKWEFPGGKNRWGETVEDTLKREFLEELSVNIEVGEPVGEHEFVNKDTHYHLKAHLIYGDFSDVRLLVHTEIRFVKLSELDDYDFAPSDRAIIEQLRKRYESA